MPRGIPALVQPALLVWAREQSGYAPEPVAKRLNVKPEGFTMRRHRTELILSVCLILLCASVYSARNRKVQKIPAGTWGGLHLRMEVADGSATIEYDCANGTIAGPLAVDRRGRFSLRGKHVQEHGGPIRMDEKANSRPARYTGWTDGKKLTLTVTLTDTNETLGTYTLVRGQQGRVFKCR